MTTEIAKIERARAVVALRREGLHLEAIASRLGISIATAWRDLQVGANELKSELITDKAAAVALELAYLDSVLKTAQFRANGGPIVDPETGAPLLDRKGRPRYAEPSSHWATVVVKICAQRAKLLGITGPETSIKFVNESGASTSAAATLDLRRLTSIELALWEELLRRAGAPIGQARVEEPPIDAEVVRTGDG